MTIFNQGGVNPSALTVPDLIVNVQPPPSVALNGVPSNIVGIVGTATWGPKNSPTLVGSLADYTLQFGPIQNRKYDAGTLVAIAQQLGANNFRVVRVTDGTDAAAIATIQTNCLTLTSKYTGSGANGDGWAIAAGTAPSSWKITLTRANRAPETFDNITGSGNTLWVNMAAAINNGQSASRGPSQLMVATAGAGTTTPTAGSGTLSSGVDGTTTISGSVLVGADTTPRTGMYALRGTGAALFALADCDDSTTWGTQLSFALSESMEAVAVSPASDTIANIGSTNTQDNPWMKLLFGDWIYWLDTINNLTRLVSPQAFYLGAKVALGVEQSVLNKGLANVVGTQKSYANQVYSAAELQALAAARVDLITNPVPGGAYFGFRFGRNTSSDPVRHQDSYTTLTNYIATTLNAGAGKFVGRLQTPTEMREAESALGAFLDNMWQAGQIGNAAGTVPYSVKVTSGQAGSGTQKAKVLVQYFDVVEYFLVDLTGGASVQIVTAAQFAAA
jgi:Phage tail sheath protein FI